MDAEERKTAEDYGDFSGRRPKPDSKWEGSSAGNVRRTLDRTSKDSIELHYVRRKEGRGKTTPS